MKKAFTLVEILVTIAVIGTISATIVPTLSHYLPGIQLNGDAKVLSSTLREAQEKTITEQKNYLVHFYPVDARYEICYLNDAMEEVSVRQEKLKSGETLSLVNTADPPEVIVGNKIVFSPDGGPSSAANITLNINDTSKIVSVTPAGFISVQ